jgi:hypothetical protein
MDDPSESDKHVTVARSAAKGHSVSIDRTKGHGATTSFSESSGETGRHHNIAAVWIKGSSSSG